MSSPELVAPARLEELLAGSFPETQSEARLQGLVRELRSSPLPAPSSLRERVGSLRSAPRQPRTRVRLAALAFAATLVAAAGVWGGTFLYSGDGSGDGSTSALRHTERNTSPPFMSRRSGSVEGQGTAASKGPLLAPNQDLPTGRAQDVNMWIDLRVKDADEVSSASQEAVRITRELGGVVASSAVDTRGKQGHAELALRIPVERVDDAAFRLTQLGTVIGQRVNTDDLQAPLDREARRIERLRSAIRIDLARLASGQLDAADELQIRIRLERHRRQLRDAKREHASIVRQAAMADLTLRLGTTTTAAVQKSEGGVSGAAHKAVDVLRGAGSVAVFLVVVLSPLLLLLVLAWLALRARSRRIEARLLDETRPGAPAAEKQLP
jgi:Domain of unknown function (DUF4349)